MATYLVTGATGFIGRHLVERLLARDAEVHVLVREGSRARLDHLIDRWNARGRVHAVSGDLRSPLLGVDPAWVMTHRGSIDHVFHLAALYDMTAPAHENEALNVGGTAEVVRLAAELDAGVLHHISSVAVAGSYPGRFTEEMFDEGQVLPSPYHRTKFEAERIVREQSQVPWRVYRPAVVVGDSRTGEMDKIDGPYYVFQALLRARDLLPQWLPLIGPELGRTNLVPVDFVVDAIDAIAHQPGLDGRAFHLVDPEMTSSTEVLNTFAKAAHAPQMALRIDPAPLDALPSSLSSALMGLPGVRDVRRAVLGRYGIPDEVVGHLGFTCSFDAREMQEALAGTSIAVPPLPTYAGLLWDYWERHLNPGLFDDHGLAEAVGGRTVLITGASSGIGRAAALRVARAGGVPLLVARREEQLLEAVAEIEDAGGRAYAYPCDLSDVEAIDALVERVLAEHVAVDVIVNNAGRSIRRSITLSLDRFHDFERTMQLNYFGAIRLVMGFLPHMRERRSGHIVNVSSIGVQTNPPRFSAYVASKAALDAWTRVVSSELLGDNVSFTTIHMPLVRTPMIAPTEMYDSFPSISAEQAGEMICDAIRRRPKAINTTLGTIGEVLYAVAPKAVDQILHAAYRVFPDSAAAKGSPQPMEAERPSVEQRAMANLMRGVHW
ncbi:unannotated protein [freshwater metagenome]|uniref:Unannotated protein n=1 Tax=freshwater metagenome TaxID=449393 RepID=A0A6J7HKE5_9ZZZZ|nr:SDR family oxidoreductase [Actinomycetota bacterium]